MLKTTNLKRSEEIAAKFGFKPAPPDHPIYKEGSTIFFVSNGPNLSVNRTKPSIDGSPSKNTHSFNSKPNQ